MITLTGLDYAAFNELNATFQNIYDNYTPRGENGTIRLLKKKTNRRRVESHDCLALVLAWTRTRGSMFVLSMIFGINGTDVSTYTRFGRRILIAILNEDEHAQVKIPSDEVIEEYKRYVEERHPLLTDVWMTMDGLKLIIEESPEGHIQNRFYNGWTCNHYVSNVFGFCPAGTIVVCCINVPCCIHDSNVCEWGHIFQKLQRVYERTGARCTVDSAFSKTACPFFIKSSNQLPLNRDEVAIHEQAKSMRQSSEWGMRSFHASFPRVKDRFLWEETGERQIILTMLVLLFNYRANKVGISQIKNTYMGPLQQMGNIYYVE